MGHHVYRRAVLACAVAAMLVLPLHAQAVREQMLVSADGLGATPER